MNKRLTLVIATVVYLGLAAHFVYANFVNSGPFQVVVHSPGYHAFIARNEATYGPQPKVRTVQDYDKLIDQQTAQWAADFERSDVINLEQPLTPCLGQPNDVAGLLDNYNPKDCFPFTLKAKGFPLSTTSDYYVSPTYKIIYNHSGIWPLYLLNALYIIAVSAVAAYIVVQIRRHPTAKTTKRTSK